MAIIEPELGLNVSGVLNLQFGTPILGLGFALNKASKSQVKHDYFLRTTDWQVPAIDNSRGVIVELFSDESVMKHVNMNKLFMHNLFADSKSDLLFCLRSYDVKVVSNYKYWHCSGEKPDRDPAAHICDYDLLTIIPDNQLVIGLPLGPVIIMRYTDKIAIAMKMFLNDQIGWFLLTANNETEPMELN